MEIIQYLISLALFTLVLSADLYTDLAKWKEGNTINHTRGLIIRMIGLLPIIFLIGWDIIPLIGFLYWFLFDGLFNYFRKFNWWFTGSDDPDDPNLDDFLQFIPLWLHKTLKISGILLSILLTVLVS